MKGRSPRLVALVMGLVLAGCGAAAHHRDSGSRRADAAAGTRARRSTVPVATPPSGQRGCSPDAEASVLAQVNAARRSAGVGALARDARLAEAARARARAMSAAGKLSHAGWERTLRQAGASGSLLGENVAWGYPSAAAVMRVWLKSRGHRANILHSAFRKMGVGCVVDGAGRLWWTQDFES